MCTGAMWWILILSVRYLGGQETVVCGELSCYHLVVLREGGGHDTPDTVRVQLQRPPAVPGFQLSGLGPPALAACIVD